MNPFYNPQMNFGSQTPFQNMFNMVSEFNNFRNSFTGDPKAKVEELLNSGKMTREQFNQLSSMAQQFRSFIR